MAQNSHRQEIISLLEIAAMVRKIIRNIINILSILIIAAALLVLMSVVMTKSGDVPNVMGYSLFRVMTGSMEPTIPVNALIVTKPVDPQDIQVGDVISYFSKDPTLNGSVNTHRVVEIREEGGTVFYQTRGDANNANDLYPPTAGEIIGVVVFSSYFLGTVVRLISNPLVFFPLVLLPLLILLVTNLVRTYRAAASIVRQEEEQALRDAVEAAKKKKEESGRAASEDS